MISAWSFGRSARTSRRAAVFTAGRFGCMESELSTRMASEMGRRSWVKTLSCCGTPSSKILKSVAASPVTWRSRPSETDTFRLTTSTADENVGRLRGGASFGARHSGEGDDDCRAKQRLFRRRAGFGSGVSWAG